MPSLSNQRGEYGTPHTALSACLPQAWTGQTRPETRPMQAETTGPKTQNATRPDNWNIRANHIIIGVGFVIGAVSWPMYAKKTPIGVLSLGAASSMVSSGIIGLLLGRGPGAF